MEYATCYIAKKANESSTVYSPVSQESSMAAHYTSALARSLLFLYYSVAEYAANRITAFYIIVNIVLRSMPLPC